MGPIARAACQPSPTSRALFVLLSIFGHIQKDDERESSSYTKKMVALKAKLCFFGLFVGLW